MKQFKHFMFSLLFTGTTTLSFAGEVDIPNTFSAGTPAIAEEVNGNFDAVEIAVDDNALRLDSVEEALMAMQAVVTDLQIQNDNLQIALEASETAAINRDQQLSDLSDANTALEEEINSLESEANANSDRITTLEAVNTQLSSFVSNVLPFIEGNRDAQGNPTVLFSGVNVHVNNGEGSTGTINGLGNLVVGYDEIIPSARFQSFCTVYGEFNAPITDSPSCETAGGTWTDGTDSIDNHKIGSHNLVLGAGHIYTQHSGLLSGRVNTLAAPDSTVSGSSNIVIGFNSNINGGRFNLTSGTSSSISGGTENSAVGSTSTVTGGRANRAVGQNSSVSGGYRNDASGFRASISGGAFNTASGDTSSVSGGGDNLASGIESSVSGGLERVANATHNWTAGSQTEDQ